MVAVIVLTVFAWAWAVRTPVPATSDSSVAPEAQAEATATATPEPLVYAAIGASDVVGVGAENPDEGNWASLVHGYMPAGTRFVRLARSGITLSEAKRVEVPQAVSADPDLITIWNVVNDATRGVPLQSYLADLSAVLDKLTQETDAQIVLLNMPDITILMNGMVNPEQKTAIRGGVQNWNKSIEQIAARYDGRVTIIDLFPLSDEVLQHPEYISRDNFHPSAAGYKRLAEVVWETVEREGLLAH